MRTYTLQLHVSYVNTSVLYTRPHRNDTGGYNVVPNEYFITIAAKILRFFFFFSIIIRRRTQRLINCYTSCTVRGEIKTHYYRTITNKHFIDCSIRLFNIFFSIIIYNVFVLSRDKITHTRTRHRRYDFERNSTTNSVFIIYESHYSVLIIIIVRMK